MRNIKKLFLVAMLVVGIFTFVGCSNSKVAGLEKDFEAQNYNMYEYKNYIAANFNLDSYLRDDELTEDDDEGDGTTSVDRVSTNQMFIPVDHLSLELRSYILDEYDILDESALDEITIEDYDDLSEIKDLNYDVFIFANYDIEEIDEETEITNSRTAVVIAFPSVAYLNEVLEVSEVLEELFAAYEVNLGFEIDVQDHVNGSLLMLIPNNVDRLEYYNDLVTIFNTSENE